MVQRWKPSWVQGRMIPAGVHPIDGYVSAADHARIVAEAGAAVFAFHPEWTVTGMCDSDCLACRRLTELITEREKGYEEGKADAEQAHAAALAEATDRQRARDYVSLWSRLMLEDRKYRAALARAAIVIRQRLTDSDVFRLTGQSVRLHEWETVKPLPADKAAAPRTLTADEWEAIAKQFRMAYQLGSCDPSNCPACDCNMDDEGRAQIAGLALQQAQAVIRVIHDGEATT